jgi:hypothetical protein
MPLWEDPVMTSLLCTALVGVLAVAAAVGRPLLGAGVAVVQVVFTLGGVRPAAVPAARPGAWLALVVSIGASVWMIVGDPSELWPVAALLGPAVVAAVMIQLARRGGRQALTASLTMTVAACALALLPVAWVALVGANGGVHAVWLGLLGVGVVGLAEVLPIPVAVRRSLAVLLAGALAAGLIFAAEGVADAVPTVGGVVLATVAALTAVTAVAAVDRVAEEVDRTTAGVLTPLRVTAPIVVAAPVAYVLGRVLVG